MEAIQSWAPGILKWFSEPLETRPTHPPAGANHPPFAHEIPPPMNPMLLQMMQIMHHDFVLWESAHGRIKDFSMRTSNNPVPTSQIPTRFGHDFLHRGIPIPASLENINHLIVSFAAYSIYDSQPRTLEPYTEAFNLVTSLRIPFRIQIPIKDPDPQSSLPIFRSENAPDNISIKVVLFWSHHFYFYGTHFVRSHIL